MKRTPRHRMHVVRLAIATFALLVSFLPVRAQIGAIPTFPLLYDLTPESRYEEGCFAPCLCPILLQDGVRGSFTLNFIGFESPFIVYEVRDISWSAPALGKTFTGSGTYRIGWRGVALQQLQVDLSENGGAPIKLDSGVVPVTAPFPAIDVAISEHGFFCYDRAFYLKAKPVRPVKLDVRVDRSSLSWDPFPDSPAYDVAIGSLGVLRQTRGDFTAATTGCLASGTTTPDVAQSDAPPAGEAFWYLVRSDGGVAGMTYDAGDPGQGGTCDAQIDAAPAACP
jgi:hypothetical protein